MPIDAFLKLRTKGASALAGEATDAGFLSSIELDDFRIGGGVSCSDVKDIGQGARARSRKYAPYGFEIKKQIDASSPYLFRAYCTSFSRRLKEEDNLFASAEVHFRKAGGSHGAYRTFVGTEFMKIVFEQVVLLTYSLTAATDGKIDETVTFAFQSVKLGYQPQAATGSTQPPREVKGWDYRKNTPV